MNESEIANIPLVAKIDYNHPVFELMDDKIKDLKDTMESLFREEWEQSDNYIEGEDMPLDYWDDLQKEYRNIEVSLRLLKNPDLFEPWFIANSDINMYSLQDCPRNKLFGICFRYIGKDKTFKDIRVVVLDIRDGERNILITSEIGRAQSTFRNLYARHLQKLTKFIPGNICEICGTKHDMLGLEVEINAIEDPIYRDAFLRKLNGKKHLRKDRDHFGVDGSGIPLEIRGINANSIDILENKFKRDLSKFGKSFNFMCKNFPYMDKKVDLNNCGLHVHLYHKDINRSIVASSHTLVGLLVNSLDTNTWKSRLSSRYGTPYNVRSNVPWCSTSLYASELRIFNPIHPKTLSSCLNNMMNIIKRHEHSHMESLPALFKNKFDTTMTYHASNFATKDVFNSCIKFFLDKGLVSGQQLRDIYDDIKANYIPLFSSKNEIKHSNSDTLDPNLIGFKTKKNKKKKEEKQEIPLINENNQEYVPSQYAVENNLQDHEEALYRTYLITRERVHVTHYISEYLEFCDCSYCEDKRITSRGER